ncbi:hypothetical protein ACS0TY_022994 [Phlomoides rotata]
MAVYRLTSKCISHTLLDGSWSCRGFVSATIPSHKKIDKETCEKVIDAAETVKDGVKDIVNEAKRFGKAVTKSATDATGTVTAELVKKGCDQAADNASTEKGKDFFDSAKAAAEAVKDKVDKK